VSIKANKGVVLLYTQWQNVYRLEQGLNIQLQVIRETIIAANFMTSAKYMQTNPSFRILLETTHLKSHAYECEQPIIFTAMYKLWPCLCDIREATYIDRTVDSLKGCCSWRTLPAQHTSADTCKFTRLCWQNTKLLTKVTLLRTPSRGLHRSVAIVLKCNRQTVRQLCLRSLSMEGSWQILCAGYDRCYRLKTWHKKCILH